MSTFTRLPDYEQGAIRGQLIAAAAPAHLEPIPTVSEWAMLLMAQSIGAMAWWKMQT